MEKEPQNVSGLKPDGAIGEWNEDVLYELRRRAWELHVRAVSHKEIALALGCKVRTVAGYLKWWRENGRDEHGENPVQARRALRLDQIDLLLATWLPKALEADDAADDPDAADRARRVSGDALDKVLKLWERESKLLGLDAPTRVDALVTPNAPTPAILERLDTVRADIEAQEAELRELPAGRSAEPAEGV